MEKTVAIVGASTDRSKYGDKAVRAYEKEGWKVFPIHPKAEEIEGHKAYPDLASVPGKIHRVSMHLPPQVGMKLLPDIATVKPEELFFNPGSESTELVEAAREQGLNPIEACSILSIGREPDEFPEE